MVPYKERDLRAAPQFLTPLVDRSVVAGYTVTLNCAVRGHPKVWGRCGVSMGWGGYGGGMGPLWVSMGHLWGPYGLSMRHLWGPYGLSMGSQWGIYGHPMGSLRGIYGVSMGSL